MWDIVSSVTRKHFSFCGPRAQKFAQHWLRYCSNLRRPTPIKPSDFGTDVSDENNMKLRIEVRKYAGHIQDQ